MLIRPRDYQPHFNEICRLALLQDEAALKCYLKDNELSVGLKIKLVSPIRHLAGLGENGAVKFLLHHFDGNANQALIGYAEAGNHEEVEALLNDSDCDVNISSAAYGYAKAGFKENAEKLVERGADSLSVIVGYATAGSIDVEEVQYQARLSHSDDIIVAAIKGYANAGRFDEVDTLLNLDRKNSMSRTVAIIGYACWGLFDKVDLLLNESRDPISRILTLTLACHGFIEGGHFSVINKYMPDAKSLPLIAASVYAAYGYVTEVNKLMSHDRLCINPAVIAYASGGFKQEVSAILQQPSVMPYRLSAIGLAIRGFCIEGYRREVNRLLNVEPFAIGFAFEACAQAGDTVEINRLLPVHPQFLQVVIHNYPKGILHTQIESLLTIASCNEVAHRCLSVNAFPTNDTLCRALAHIQDDAKRKAFALAVGQQAARREEFALAVGQQTENLNSKSALSKANKIRHIMQAYQLDYPLAETLTIPGARTWLLEGQLATCNMMQIDAFLHLNIAKQLLCLSGGDTQAVLKAVQQHHSQSFDDPLNSPQMLTRRRHKRLANSTQAYSRTSTSRIGLFDWGPIADDDDVATVHAGMKRKP